MATPRWNSAWTPGAHEFANVTVPSASPCDGSCPVVDCCGAAAPMAVTATTRITRLRCAIAPPFGTGRCDDTCTRPASHQPQAPGIGSSALPP